MYICIYIYIYIYIYLFRFSPRQNHGGARRNLSKSEIQVRVLRGEKACTSCCGGSTTVAAPG